MGEVEEERAVVVALDEIHRALGVAGRQLLLIRGGDVCLDDVVTLNQWQQRMIDVLFFHPMRPHVVRVGQTVILIKAVTDG